MQMEVVGIAADTQFLSHKLHSSKLEYLGLAVAIRSFCKEFGEQQKVEIRPRDRRSAHLFAVRHFSLPVPGFTGGSPQFGKA